MDDFAQTAMRHQVGTKLGQDYSASNTIKAQTVAEAIQTELSQAICSANETEALLRYHADRAFGESPSNYNQKETETDRPAGEFARISQLITTLHAALQDLRHQADRNTTIA